MAHSLDEITGLTDAELVCRLERLVKADRALSALLLVHLGEMEARRLYSERGFSSMFDYCMSGLGMSEGEAGLRIQAARLGRRFPLVLERLAGGALHLSGIRLLAPLLTDENHVELLDRARGKSKRQIQVLIAELAPKPDVKPRITRLPEPRAVTESGDPAFPETAPAVISSSTAAQPVAAPTFALEAPRARASVTPRGPGRFALVVPLGQEGHDNLEKLVELLRHQNPSGDVAKIIERALRELLEREMKRRFAQTQDAKLRAPRSDVVGTAKGVAAAKSRYIPRRVLGEVYARDGGQCTYVSPDGRRCTARGFLEVHHHTVPCARGGEATVENLRLTCRPHNLLFADRDYGPGFMQTKLREVMGRRQVSRAVDPGADRV